MEGDLSCLDRKGWRDRRLWTVTAACAFTEMPAGDFTPHSRALGVLSGLGGGMEGFLLCEDFDSCGQRLLWRGGVHSLFPAFRISIYPKPRSL